MDKNIIIGSRGSDLALWQAHYVKDQLNAIGITAEINIIKTQGDKIQHLSFDKLEGKGFFTKEIEDALLNGDIDLAVHSHKDLETTPPEGLVIAAVSEREDPSEFLLIRKEAVDIRLPFSLKAKAVVGTSSARRKTQLLAVRNDIELKDLRGNVPTRIQKLRDGQYDAIMLAAAGVRRLEIDLSDLHVEQLDPREFVPAPAQGALALQVRATDEALIEALAALNSDTVQETIAVERKVLNLFEGGCQLPLGVYCIKEGATYKAWAAASKTWEDFPKRIYTEALSTAAMAQNIVEQLQHTQHQSVFVSRNIKAGTYFWDVLEKNGLTVVANSLTRFEQVPYDTIPSTDWIFFSSKNCVKYFFAQQPTLAEGVKFGTIGGATAIALKQEGIVADYTGASTDTEAIGKEFAQQTKGSTVLFPQSTASYRTIQKQFDDQARVYDLIAYDTVENEQARVPETDVIVLTSPSNAILYLRQRTIAPHQKVIAMGKSTAKVLEEHGITHYQLPWNSSVMALTDAVLST